MIVELAEENFELHDKPLSIIFWTRRIKMFMIAHLVAMTI